MLPTSMIASNVPQNFSFDVHATLGAVEIGVLASTTLFGILTVQVYIYFTRFPKDSQWIKVMGSDNLKHMKIGETNHIEQTQVTLLWILEFGHAICICNALYLLTITQYGHPELLQVTPQSLNVAILFSGFIGPMEQGWFALRIYKFSKSLYLPLTCAILTTLRLAGSITLAAVAFARPTIQEYQRHWTWLLTSILVIGACVDVLLAAALCYYLRRYRGQEFERAARVVASLMLWAVETGLVTSIAAVSMAVCYFTMKENFVWIGLFTILARLFSNSLLASLNARPVFADIYRQDVLKMSLSEQGISARGRQLLDLSQVSPTQSPVTSPHRQSFRPSFPIEEVPLDFIAGPRDFQKDGGGDMFSGPVAI